NRAAALASREGLFECVDEPPRVLPCGGRPSIEVEEEDRRVVRKPEFGSREATWWRHVHQTRNHRDGHLRRQGGERVAHEVTRHPDLVDSWYLSVEGRRH